MCRLLQQYFKLLDVHFCEHRECRRSNCLIQHLGHYWMRTVCFLLDKLRCFSNLYKDARSWYHLCKTTSPQRLTWWVQPSRATWKTSKQWADTKMMLSRLSSNSNKRWRADLSHSGTSMLVKVSCIVVSVAELWRNERNEAGIHKWC